MAETDIAWAAGFFDGEGYIGIKPIRVGRTVVLMLNVAQVDRRPLDKMATVLGGKVIGPYQHKAKNHNQYYVWHASSQAAQKALRMMLPYLTGKHAQAEIAIEFGDYYEETKRPGLKTPPDVLARRQEFADRIIAERMGKSAAER